MTMFSLQFLFWISLGLLAYAHVAYPVLIWALSRIRPRPVRKALDAPPLSVVIVAHNEASRIEGKIRNLLSLDYPRHHLEILVGDDGSTDDTVDRARAFQGAGVTLVSYARRRGKAAVLNDLVRMARREIVVLADARQRFEIDTLRALVAPFGDPRVGAVSGELVLTDADAPGGTQGVGVYWRYEKLIRWSESQVDSTVGATGAIYAIRADLFEPIPEDTILDDVVIPLHIVRQGYRVIFEPRARAYDRVAQSSQVELTRKVRTLAGNFQLFTRERWLLNSFRNRLWFQTLSHKGLRLLAPLLQGMALATNFFLASNPGYRTLLAAQALFYATALGGYALRNTNRKHPVLTLPYTFCLFSWATVVGFIRFATGSSASPGRSASHDASTFRRLANTAATTVCPRQ
ncbi:MAG TPA: glycosyltransferase family 2 protein [bacterium]|nr:glycosyltransferase family 2 protein [bacterium]